MKTGLSGKALEAVLDKIERRAKEEESKGNTSQSLALNEARRIIWNAWITTTEPKKPNRKKRPKGSGLGNILGGMNPGILSSFCGGVVRRL